MQSQLLELMTMLSGRGREDLKLVPGINHVYMLVSLNYCSQNGGNLYRAPYYNGNPNIGPRIIGNLDQYPHACIKAFEAEDSGVDASEILSVIAIRAGNRV